MIPSCLRNSPLVRLGITRPRLSCCLALTLQLGPALNRLAATRWRWSLLVGLLLLFAGELHAIGVLKTQQATSFDATFVAASVVFTLVPSF